MSETRCHEVGHDRDRPGDQARGQRAEPGRDADGQPNRRGDVVRDPGPVRRGRWDVHRHLGQLRVLGQRDLGRRERGTARPLRPVSRLRSGALARVWTPPGPPHAPSASHATAPSPAGPNPCPHSPRQPQRWNIAVVITAPMFHRCRQAGALGSPARAPTLVLTAKLKEICDRARTGHDHRRGEA